VELTTAAVRRAAAGLVLLALPVLAAPAPPTADEIVRRVLDSDPWGLGDADVSARAIVRDQSGRARELAFRARSLRYAPPLTKSIVRFSAPADLAGVGFLLIQNATGDDERWLFLPELGRSRRIAGDTRTSAFMGTDFSYADLDRRELRYGTATRQGEETVQGAPCFKVEVRPTQPRAPYARIELWVGKDDYVPRRWLMYAASGTLLKTLEAEEVKQVDGRWFILRSRMTDHRQRRTTELILDAIRPEHSFRPDEFTVRNLEKL
jgi:outer membrane lipoprotein-sorting protein